MPGYLAKALQRFNHPTPAKQQNSPHPHITPNYGAKVQYSTADEDSPPLNKEDTKYIQAVAGTLLYYGRAVDNTILTSLSAVATEQAKPTQKTMEVIKQLLDYCATSFFVYFIAKSSTTNVKHVFRVLCVQSLGTILLW